MRMGMALAMAMALVGSAMAAPVSWVATGDWTSVGVQTASGDLSENGIYWKNDFSATGNFALCVTYSGVSLKEAASGNGWYTLAALNIDGVDDSYRVAYSNKEHNATLGPGWYIDPEKATDIVLETQPSLDTVLSGGNTLSAYFVYDADASAFSFFVNAYYLGTVDGLDLTGKNMDITCGSASGGTNGRLSGAFDLSAAPSITFAEVTILPEPTALALLALGVAGLALRRRVV